MAFRAFTFFRTRRKLALVRIGLVAVHALGERQGLFEVAIQVACGAADLDMHSEKRVLRLGMVEFKGRQEFLPTGGCVACFAALLERALVRIEMAGGARVKLHVLVASGPARLVRLVAFLASDLDMQASQRVARFRMIELRGLLPIEYVVATLTIVAELPFVGIGVAR